MEKVIVGMSGGVDSSVTAYLLKEQGYEVEGVSFILYEARLRNTFSGCCSIESINDARKTADRIGVPHAAIDLREEFLEKVIEPFIDAYKNGFTPNPCILCNKYIKFPYLLKAADERGAAYIATGHYAQVEHAASPTPESLRLSGDPGSALKKGVDPKKDQSYVLYVLSREEVSRLILPLGAKTKDAVRETARMLGLPAAQRPESQEICFIGDKNYCTFFEGLTDSAEGPIIDVETGKIMGSHRGIYRYTMGQRKGLGIATGKPLYVAGINYTQNAVYVGPREAAMGKAFAVEEINWLVPPAAHSFRATVKVRSTMSDEPATVTVTGDTAAEVDYDTPQWAPAPGQSAVFYDGDRVLGGGIITRNF